MECHQISYKVACNNELPEPADKSEEVVIANCAVPFSVHEIRIR